jgi:hypothetical protein
MIAVANKFFRDGNYIEALKRYQQIIEVAPIFKSSLLLNIQLCQLRLFNIDRNTVTAKPLKEAAFDSVNSLVNCSLHDLLGAGLPKKHFIKGLLDSISNARPSKEMLLAILMCVRSSPFQRDLLWYSAAVMKKLGMIQAPRDRSNSDEFTLLALINLASQPTAWLRLRPAFRQWLEKNRIVDPRAWDLYVRCPDDLGDSHMRLPAYKAPVANVYSWLQSQPYQVKQHSKLSFTLATILLNEQRFIGLNLLQHYDFCTEWVLVEGACQGYPPRKVSQQGLSLDNCAAQIRLFPDPKGKLRFIQHGWTVRGGEDAKSEIRNRYLEKITTDLLVVIDADEFYRPNELKQAIDLFKDPSLYGLTLPQVHFWKGTTNFITGEYFDIPHTRIYRNINGMRYIRNHNFPELGGKYVHEYGHMKLSRSIYEIENDSYAFKAPCCYHMGFAKDYDDMRDKTDYYLNRGEMVTRKSTTLSRAAWFDVNLPETCRVRQWGGGMPEMLVAKKDEQL